MSGVGNVPGGSNPPAAPDGQSTAPAGRGALAQPVPGRDSSGAPAAGAPGAAPGGPGDVSARLADAGVVVPSGDFDAAGDVGGARRREVDSEPERDRVDHRPRPAPKEDRRETRDAPPAKDRTQANPFEALREPVREAEAHVLGEPVDLDTEVDLPPKTLGKLMGFAAKMTGKDAGFEKGLAKVLEGALLGADDAQEAAVRKEGFSRADARAIAHEVRTLSAKQRAIKIAKLQEMLRLSRLGNDPVAFVQRVMRESYAIGNEIMRDYAERMKKANALRKAIRNEAQRTREALTANAGKESTDALTEPFEVKDVDSVRGQVVEAFYSVQDAEEAMAETADAVGSTQERPPWDRPDSLSPGDRLNLEKWAGDDDDIEDNLGRIKSLAQRVSVEEFDRYIHPLMVRLAIDDDEDELVELLEALPPYLRLRAVAQKIGEWDGKSIREALTGSESDEYEVLRNRALDELARECGEDLHGIWFSRGADAALEAYEEAMLSPSSGDESLDPARAIEAGARRTAHTVGELKDYEKYLEDQLNSVGDDAQLMNVELQNQLQKQQQLLQMMSNLSKAMHDAAMSIVRKLEG